MKFVPHAYQQKGIEWIERNPYCALFWDMGLGKSVTTLTAFQRLQDLCEVRNMLVIAPKTVAEATWSGETCKWQHLDSLIVSKIIGDRRHREAAADAEADVYVINRDNFVWLAERCKYKLPYDMVVIDELTSFKSSGSQRFKAFRKCRKHIRRVVGLTGTPTANGLKDLWAQMYCIDMGARLGPFKTRWENENFDIFRVNGVPVNRTMRKGALERNTAKIADVCMTLKAADYLTLPALIEHDVMIPLSESIGKRYNDFERERVIEFAEEEKEDECASVIAINAAALMNKLSQFASGSVYDSEGTAHHIHDEKVPYLLDIVEGAHAQGSGVLVFYQFRSEVPALMEALKQYNPCMYEGESTLKAWNEGATSVLLAHPASVAYGLNMQAGGSVIVWTSPTWNLEQYLQANARLHRQGQGKIVHVYRLIARDTVDEQALSSLKEKKGTQDAVLSALKKLQRKHL